MAAFNDVRSPPDRQYNCRVSSCTPLTSILYAVLLTTGLASCISSLHSRCPLDESLLFRSFETTLGHIAALGTLVPDAVYSYRCSVVGV